jgi:hypothetical protein
VTWAFWKKYVDEGWVALDQDGVQKAGAYFTGLPSFYALGVAFTDLTGEANPLPQPEPTPGPPSPLPVPAPSADPRLVQALALMQAWAHDNNVTSALAQKGL